MGVYVLACLGGALCAKRRGRSILTIKWPISARKTCGEHQGVRVAEKSLDRSAGNRRGAPRAWHDREYARQIYHLGNI